MDKKQNAILSWVAQLGAIAILAPAVYYKFVAAEPAIQNFTTLGMEPGGRILIGVLELMVVIMLLVPGLIAWGGILGWGLMTGALIAHFTKLGMTGPAASSFYMAIGTWVMCSAICYFRRDKIVFLNSMFGGRSHRGR